MCAILSKLDHFIIEKKNIMFRNGQALKTGTKSVYKEILETIL
jgi:hypothetical protein